MRTIRTILITTLLACMAPPLLAGENDDFRFAQRLQRDGMFVAAAEEFGRFAEKYPESTLRPLSFFNAGESWMRAGRAAEAMSAFEALLAGYPSHETACRARFYRGDILRLMKKYREAADELLMVEESYPDCPLKGKALLTAGECLISGGDSPAAASILRRLSDSDIDPGLRPRAMYSLAVALGDIQRDLEADDVLKKLVADHSGSPVAALALIRLGDRAMEKGELDEAERYFRKAADSHSEASLREKAVLKIIDVLKAAGDDDGVLEQGRSFLGEFAGSGSRPIVYRDAVYSAWNLREYDRALGLIESWRSEGTVSDSIGEISLLKGKILSDRGRYPEALEELASFRHTWTRSPLLGEALLLESELLGKTGDSAEAASRLHMALLEETDSGKRTAILSRIAEISADALADTFSAMRYWDMVAVRDETGVYAEEALWRCAEAKERLGDIKGAASRFARLRERFPAGVHGSEASARLERLDLAPRPDAGAIREIASYALADYPPHVKSLEVGVLLLEKGDMPKEAIQYFNRALKDELPAILEAKTRYYLGSASFREYELSVYAGDPDEGRRKQALGHWLKVARESAGSEWGGKGHRKYIENKLDEWKVPDRLQRIDEFLGYYGGTPDRWWALEEKASIFYEEAISGKTGAADSALAIYEEIAGGDAPGDILGESILKSAYLLRLKGNQEGAAGRFRRFISSYGDDPRRSSVLYDLGETLLAMKNYKGALDAYSGCAGSEPPRSLAARCALRIGDCHYYNHDFQEATRSYGSFGKLFPESELVDEASYREALALERLGRFDKSDSLLAGLESKEGLPLQLRARLLSRLGERLVRTGKADEAVTLLRELVSIDRKHENLSLYGEVLFETGAFRDSERVFSDAVRFEGADSCRIYKGRAMALYRQGEKKRAGKDLELLLRLFPGCPGIPEVLLEKGAAEISAGELEAAVATLNTLRERYPGSPEGSTALYHLAICDLKRGGYSEAVDKLTAFLREMPGTPILGDAYFKLASAHYGAGNLSLAAVNYRRAAEASDDDAVVFRALKNMATIYQESEEWEKAAEGWYTLCERFPSHEDIVELFFNLGFSYGQSGRYEMAWEVYKRIPGVATSEEQQGRAHYWAGISLKNLGRCPEAIREFLRVPYLRTGGMWGVTAKMEAAVCYERTGRIDQAIQIYERIIASSGERSDWGSLARKALDRINGTVEKQDEAGEQQGDDSGASVKKEE